MIGEEEEDTSAIDQYDQTDLARVSEIAWENYQSLHSFKELNFQEKLHLEVQVEETRNLIFQCNLELADFITTSQFSQPEIIEKKIVEEESENKPTLTQRNSSDP